MKKLLFALTLPVFICAQDIAPFPKALVHSVWAQSIWADGKHNGFPGIAQVGEPGEAIMHAEGGIVEPDLLVVGEIRIDPYTDKAMFGGVVRRDLHVGSGGDRWLIDGRSDEHLADLPTDQGTAIGEERDRCR